MCWGCVVGVLAVLQRKRGGTPEETDTVVLVNGLSRGPWGQVSLGDLWTIGECR